MACILVGIVFATPACQVLASKFNASCGDQARINGANDLYSTKAWRLSATIWPLNGPTGASLPGTNGLPHLVVLSTLTVFSGMRHPLARLSWMRSGISILSYAAPWLNIIRPDTFRDSSICLRRTMLKPRNHWLNSNGFVLRSYGQSKNEPHAVATSKPCVNASTQSLRISFCKTSVTAHSMP